MLLFQNGVDLRRFIYHMSDGRSTILGPIASGTINGLIYGAAIRRGGARAVPILSRDMYTSAARSIP